MRSERGFTLVEVIVALVVMASAVAILAQGFTTGGSASVTAQNRTKAAWLAEEKMADVEAGLLSLTMSQGGTLEEMSEGRWDVKSDTTATQGLYQVTVTITWRERSEDRTFSLVRLMRERPQE